MKDNKLQFSNLLTFQNNCVSDESKITKKNLKTFHELQLFDVSYIFLSSILNKFNIGCNIDFEKR